MRRLAQLSWVIPHLDDIESDMSAIHRVDDIWSMPAAKFFRFAWRLPCYRGAMRERALAEQHGQEQGSAAPVRQATQPAPRAAPSHSTPVTKQAMSDPVMSKIFDFG
jgi:hypothetical protein